MDATQLISDSFLGSDEEEQVEESKNDRGDPLGKLCVLKNKHIHEKEFPLFLGDNMLGRDPNTCTLSLLAPSVSKQHATISLSVYRRKGCKSEVEALVWDLGSMNGTHKGCFKLTPNVRYALSEGDSLVVADIPCKYMTCTADAPHPPKDTGTPVTQNLKAGLSDALIENGGGNLNSNETKSTAVSTKTTDTLDSEVTRGTPVRTSCLSFEQTPTQPQGTLAPDSESESDEERFKLGDRKRKNIVSDSDSFRSSPTCSTFMSPTNKVVPESEDESPITPSSSYKNWTRSVVGLNEEIDRNINRQELRKQDPLEIVDDSEAETGNDKAKASSKDTPSKNGQPELAKSECNTSPTEGVKSLSATNVKTQFNMDSDTDVEEEAATGTIKHVTASNADQFHIDSDTDDNDTSAPLDSHPSSEDTTKHSHTTGIPIFQPKGISMDSDTDVDDEDLLSAANAKTRESQTARTAEEAQRDFNLDSDTDVEGETNIIDSKEDKISIKQYTSTTAAPQCLDLDSDTDDEGMLSVAVREEPVDSAKPDLMIMSNSDTDKVKPATSGFTAAESKLDSGEDTDVNESFGLQNAEGNPADVSMDSDTEVEDKEAGDKKVPILDREITPGIQVASLQTCSTPVQEVNVEEMETQAFLSPSLSSFRCPVAPGRPVTFSPCVDNQEEDDFVVADTQPFILNDRGQNTPPKDPDNSSVLNSSVREKDVSSTCGGDFQLELSDSSHCQAQALDMESTQAYITVDAGLEETHADAIITNEKELPVDIALQATQAYIFEPFSDEEEESADYQSTKHALTGVQEDAPRSPVPQSNQATIKGEGEKQIDVMDVAETQPMCIDENDDGEEYAPFFQKRKPWQIQEKEKQPLTNSKPSVSKTQPVEMSEDGESEEDLPPDVRKRKAKQLHLEEEQTQPIEMPIDDQSDEEDPTQISRERKVEQHETQPRFDSVLITAQTQPITIVDNEESDDEDSVPVVTKSPIKRQLQEEEKTLPLVNFELSVAPTQPLGLSEEMESDEEYSIAAPRKRKAKPLEDTQSLTNTEVDTQDTKPLILKETKGSFKSETGNVSVCRRGGGGKLGNEKHEATEDVSSEPPTRRTKGKNEAASVSQGRRGKAKIQREDESEVNKAVHQEAEEDTKGQMKQKEKEGMEQKEKASKIRKEREQNEMLEREKREREEKERIEKLQKEREEKERMEAAKRAEEEEEEGKNKERKARLEMEERVRLEKEKQAETKEEDQAPRRGRRTARRTTAAPDSTSLDTDDVPARRTRSRSNSTNSLSSERSVSSVTSQNSRGRGRGRGGRRSDVPVLKTPVRASNWRRTVSAETPNQTEVSALSPGSVSMTNSPNSLTSEISVSSVSSQGRGRGGRQRGRGRRAEPEPESVRIQCDQISIQKAWQRGRKSRKVSPENVDNKTVSQQYVSTRGQGRAVEESSKGTLEDEEGQAHHEEASTSTTLIQKAHISSKENPDSSQVSTDERRRGRKRQTEAKKEAVTKSQTAEEQKGEDPTVKRKTGAKNTSAKKSVKYSIDDNTTSEKQKGRGRASVVQKKKKSEEEDDSGSTDNSMEQEATPREQEVPQTPTNTASRKRHSAILEASPVAKTPRSSNASPGTVGRSRAASQAYKVLFTGVVDEAGEKVLSRLGASIAKDVTDMNCLVTDKVRRTVKFLCAVAKGVPIVTTQWLEKSGKAGTFLSPSTYIVKDHEQEQKFNFSLQESLMIANNQPLLQGYEIHVTKSVRPEPVQMKDIITCSGALFLPRMPSSKKSQTLVISCEEDWPLCGPAVSSAIPVLTAEFILTGMLQQKLDFETHKLSGPVAPAQTLGGKGKGRKK